MRIAFFGSSLVSAYWNGAATYYRGIIRALHARGHAVTFFEPDAYDRQKHRDIEDPPWAEVRVYPADEGSALAAVAAARPYDLVVKASGVGVFDALLERAVLSLSGPSRLVAYWDVDAPATLSRLAADPADPFVACVPEYDLILTYGGGAPVVKGYRSLGARRCVPIYNGFDPATHFPAAAEERFRADVSFLGNRLPDREARVEHFFISAAERLSDRSFVLGGAGWGDKPVPGNVRYVGHVYTRDHNAFNASADFVLNVSRESMVEYGYSPATRFFEAAGAGACVLTDYWEGIEQFLAPGQEVLVARDTDEVITRVRGTPAGERRRIAAAARRRVLAEHTYERRVAELERVLEGKGSYQEAS